MGQPRKIRNYEAESNPSEPMEVDDRGRLIIAMLKEAREHMERTRRVSQALALQVRESQAHTQRLEENLKHFEARAQNAEGWVLRVQQEIQDVYSDLVIAELHRLFHRGIAETNQANDHVGSTVAFPPESRAAEQPGRGFSKEQSQRLHNETLSLKAS